MSILLVPFQYFNERMSDKPYTVYMINEDNPNKSGYTQGYWECTHCGEGSQFRFYDDSNFPNYQAKCPKCRKEFIAVDDTDWS